MTESIDRLVRPASSIVVCPCINVESNAEWCYLRMVKFDLYITFIVLALPGSFVEVPKRHGILIVYDDQSLCGDN